MKKITLMLLIISLTLIPKAYAENPGKKLFRGAANIVTAPIEVPKQARAYWIEGAQKTYHILVWIGSGVVYGLAEGVKRTGSGVWDVVSFPFETPDDYAPLLEPEFVFDEWPRNPVSGR